MVCLTELFLLLLKKKDAHARSRKGTGKMYAGQQAVTIRPRINSDMKTFKGPNGYDKGLYCHSSLPEI